MLAAKHPVQRQRPEANHRSGFTLMEVLLVLVILVVLASLAVTSYRGIQERALKDSAKTKVAILTTPIDAYQMATRTYPSSLQDLVTRPSDSRIAERWSGPYLKENNSLLDPWDNEMRFAAPGKHNTESYDVWSVGPDGQDGTDDDIGNW